MSARPATPGFWTWRKRGDGDLARHEVYYGDTLFALVEGPREAHFIVEACNSHDTLTAQRDTLAEALRECVTDDPGSACYNTGKKTRRLEAINEIARAALATMDGGK